MSKMLDNKYIKTIDLSNEEFQRSKDPILKNCKCYTCKKYNRSYLYHLLDVKEMNANILIGM